MREERNTVPVSKSKEGNTRHEKQGKGKGREGKRRGLERTREEKRREGKSREGKR